MSSAKEAVRSTETKMGQAVEGFKSGLGKIRAGRASANMLDAVRVESHGSLSPLASVASVSTPDPRTIAVRPFERAMAGKIEKAIREAGLGLNPAAQGDVVRVPLPPLSEERRRELVKQAKDLAEQAKVSIRGHRRDGNEAARRLAKEKAVNEGEAKKAEADIQKLTDKAVAEVDALLAAKEREIMAV